MQGLNKKESIDTIQVKMETDLKKLEKELEKILEMYPRYIESSVEKLSTALDRYYQVK